MKVKYQITMEVEVEVDSGTELVSGIGERLVSYTREGFIGRSHTRDNAVVNKVQVSRIGATGVVPKDTRHK